MGEYHVCYVLESRDGTPCGHKKNNKILYKWCPKYKQTSDDASCGFCQNIHWLKIHVHDKKKKVSEKNLDFAPCGRKC